MSTRKQQSRGNSGSEKLTRSQRRAKDRRKKKLTSISMMAAGALIIVAAMVLFQGNTEVRLHPMEDANALGDPNAPVVITEFSDFRCSHCYNFFNQSEQKLIQDYVATGKVRFIYRSYGYALSEESGRAAEAAYCAEDQGKFWDMHDILFNNFGTNYSDSKFISFAKDIDMDVTKFEDCLLSGKYIDRTKKDQLDAAAAGITGTPNFLINGELQIIGNEPFSSFQQKIEAALAAAGN